MHILSPILHNIHVVCCCTYCSLTKEYPCFWFTVVYRDGAIGATGAALATALLAPLEKNGDIFKPRYICTSDSSIHVNIVVVRAVLALHAILTDTKVFWTCSQTQTEGVVFRTRSLMLSCGAQ